MIEKLNQLKRQNPMMLIVQLNLLVVRNFHRSCFEGKTKGFIEPKRL